MADTMLALSVLVPALLGYLFIIYRNWRLKKFAYIPHHIPNNLWTGHFGVMANGYKNLGGDTRRHFDYVVEDALDQTGRPEFLFLDLRPLQNIPLLVIASHSLAEQVSKTSKLYPWSVTKSPTYKSHEKLIGEKSFLTLEGSEWKALRKAFNPGFAPQHIQSLLPQILDKVSIFVEKLDALAVSGATQEIASLCTNLTFDIIGKVVMNVDFHSLEPERSIDFVRHYQALLDTCEDTGRLPLWLNIPNRITQAIEAYRSNAALKHMIQSKFSAVKHAQSGETKATKDRSVLALAFKDMEVLSPQLLQETADHVKTFLFAGHDTTATLLQWLFYALSIHPKCLATLRAEHDAVFGDRDPRDVFLEQPDETFKSLPYTSACIKEGLRLWPPAGTARRSTPGSGFKIRLENGDEFCAEGCVLYNCHYLIQRDPKVYGETADDFIPERWLGDTDTSMAHTNEEAGNAAGASKIPISAWRAFEWGPRNCIGQELANLEARVILACTVRRYDFVKVGAGEVEVDEKGMPIVDEKGRCKTKSELFNCLRITSKPFDNCVMKVKMRQPSASA